MVTLLDTETVFFTFEGAQKIDFKESIPPVYVAWRADTITLSLLGSYHPIDCYKIPARVCATKPDALRAPKV